jgi:hypothetical protein
MNPIVQSMMGQAQTAMSNPMGQAVPQGGGLIDVLKHPLVGAIVKALAQAAQSYGWTAMQPSERLERTQLNQQKAETLSRLAMTGAEQGINLDIKQGQLGVNQQRANTAEQRAVTAEELAKFRMQFEPQQQAERQRHNEAMEALRQKDITRSYAAINNEMDMAKLRYDAAMKELGPKWAEIEVQDNRNNIMEYIGQLQGVARQQENTEIGQNAQRALGDMQTKAWFQAITGSTGIQTLGGAAQGVASSLPQIPAAPTLVQPSIPPNVGAPTPQNKAAAKSKQKAPSAPSGGGHYWFDSLGNMVTQPNAR